MADNWRYVSPTSNYSPGSNEDDGLPEFDEQIAAGSQAVLDALQEDYSPGSSPGDGGLPEFDDQIAAGSQFVLDAIQQAQDREDVYDGLVDYEEDFPVPHGMYEGLQQGIGAGRQAVYEALDAHSRSGYVYEEEALTEGGVSAEAIAAGYAYLLNSINQVQEKMPDGEYNAVIGPLLDHHYVDERSGEGAGLEPQEEGVEYGPEYDAAAAAAQEKLMWQKNIAGREVHELWTEGQKRDFYVQSLHEDSRFLMEKQAALGHADASPHDELDLQDIQMTFIKMTIATGRRRYLLPLALQIKKVAERRAVDHADNTNYKPVIQVLVLGYFFPEFYRDYDNRERQREVTTFKRKYLGSLDMLTKIVMEADPEVRKKEAVQEKWREAMDVAIDVQAMEEIEDEIREQALFAAEEALMEQSRWGPEWLEEISVLVDTAIYNAKVPNVRGKKFSLIPEEGTGIGDVVLTVVEEAMDGRIGIDDASAAIKAVLNVVPEVFAANPNPEMAAAPIAAALQAALAVVQEGPVSAALQEGDIAAALSAVKDMEAIQTIPGTKVALALQSVLEQVHNAPFGRQHVRARAALRSIVAALQHGNVPDQADHDVAGQVLQAVANVAANAAAQGAANAMAAIPMEGVDRPPQEDIQAAVGNAAQAAATGAVETIGQASSVAVLEVIAGASVPGSPGVNRLGMANAVVDAAEDAAPEAVVAAQNMAQQAVQQVVQHAQAAVNVEFHVVTFEELLLLPVEEQEALRKTARQLIQLGRNNRPDSIVQALLKDIKSNFGLLYVEKLFKKIFETLSHEEKFLPGIAQVLVSFHRFLMLRRRKRLPKRTFENYESIPLNEGRVEVDKMITAIIVATQREAKGESTVDRIIDEAFHKGRRLFIEHLYMGLSWDVKQKTMIPTIYNTMRKIHDFILMK